MAQTPPFFARPVKNAVYDVNTLSWVPMEQPVISGDTLNVAISGGSLAVTVADGADVTQGALADAAWSYSGNSTLVSLLKRLTKAYADSDSPGTPVGLPVTVPSGFTVNDGAPTGAGGTQRIGMAAMTNNRAQHVNLRSLNGVEVGIQSAPIYTRPDGTKSASGSISVPTGAVTSSDAIAFAGASGVLIQISGSWSGTLEFQSNAGGGGYTAQLASNLTTGAIASSTTANGLFLMPAGQTVRVYGTALASGSATVAFYAQFGTVGGWQSITDGGGSLTVDGTINTKTALTASAPAAVSVGVASTAAVAANANRKGLILVNTSAAYISLEFSGGTAVLYSGITLAPNGSYNMGEYDFSTGAVNAIASIAASNLGIQEYT